MKSEPGYLKNALVSQHTNSTCSYRSESENHSCLKLHKPSSKTPEMFPRARRRKINDKAKKKREPRIGSYKRKISKLKYKARKKYNVRKRVNKIQFLYLYKKNIFSSSKSSEDSFNELAFIFNKAGSDFAIVKN